MEEKNYQKHPNQEFVKMFTDKPYQGQHPAKASIIILGYDANYSEEIREHKDFFQLIVEYHNDGVAFWKKYGVHHPFLHENYPFDKTKDGVPYHRNFAKIELSQDAADKISFVELLDVPTVGQRCENKKLFLEMLNPHHLKWLEDSIFTGDKKLVLVSSDFYKQYLKVLQKNHSFFKELHSDVKPLSEQLIKNVTFFYTYHFSTWQIHKTIPLLQEKIANYL